MLAPTLAFEPIGDLEFSPFWGIVRGELKMTWRAICLLSLLSFAGVCGCGKDEPWSPPPPPTPEQPQDLRLNELVSNNQGVWVDEVGEADDYLELYNASAEILNLGNYEVTESSGRHALPAQSIAPGETLLLWADDTVSQGPLHLPFKLSASGETVILTRTSTQEEVDRATLPALDEHHAWLRIPDGLGAFQDCEWASPSRANGDRCGPIPPVDLPERQFASFTWPSPWPAPPSPLAINELALRPARFIEISNRTDQSVDLTKYALRLAPMTPGDPWPPMTAGLALQWPASTLAPGGHLEVPLSEADASTVAASPNYEGVLTLWAVESNTTIDRVEFNQWPVQGTLARFPDSTGTFRYCIDASPGTENGSCEALPSRPVGDHLRYLHTPADFSALASGRHQLSTEAVEFVIDLQGEDEVYLLDAASWDLHYTFIREAIQGKVHLDRCVAPQHAEFNRGWYAFSVTEYFQTEGRRYLLGTLVHHAGSGLHTVEFTPGDEISSAQMEHAFFTLMQHVDDPSVWALRPQSPEQRTTMAPLEGRLPMVDINAPFHGQTYQSLVAEVGFGTLKYVPSDKIKSASLGPRDILITDQVPNDIPLIGGLITEAFQTPLAHVAVLSRGRGTPNMALAGARKDPRVAPLLNQLVRLEVTGGGFTLAPADPAEALAFWEARKPKGTGLSPRLDLQVRGVQPLSERSLADIPSIGGKAAQLAELGRVEFCEESTHVPPMAFAVPLVHSVEHYEASGATALLTDLRTDPQFAADPTVREQGLSKVRALILTHEVDPELLQEVTQAIQQRWPTEAVRFRSSSNTEDLSTFNGAGLYQSVGVDADPIGEGANSNAVASAIRAVWASLFDRRAYDEREYYSVNPTSVAMAVLIHPAHRSERANGVAISRDALNPSRGDRYYFNAQVGEALVTNPAPGVASDEIIYDPNRPPYADYQAHSSLNQGKPVLSDDELRKLACNLELIHSHFRPLLDPQNQNSWFAMDIEFKLMGTDRTLVIKQARPYSFGASVPSGWCDF